MLSFSINVLQTIFSNYLEFTSHDILGIRHRSCYEEAYSVVEKTEQVPHLLKTWMKEKKSQSNQVYHNMPKLAELGT